MHVRIWVSRPDERMPACMHVCYPRPMRQERCQVAPASAPRRGRAVSPVAMTPVTRTDTRVTHLAGPGTRTRRECWQAVSTDGRWRYARRDDVGTIWIVTDIPAGVEAEPWFGTLSAARRATATWR